MRMETVVGPPSWAVARRGRLAASVGKDLPPRRGGGADRDDGDPHCCCGSIGAAEAGAIPAVVVIAYFRGAWRSMTG